MQIRAYAARPVSFKNDEGKAINGTKLTVYGDTGTYNGLWLSETDLKAESQAIEAARKDGAEVFAEVKLAKGKRPQLEAIVAKHYATDANGDKVLLTVSGIWSKSDEIIVTL